MAGACIYNVPADLVGFDTVTEYDMSKTICRHQSSNMPIQQCINAIDDLMSAIKQGKFKNIINSVHNSSTAVVVLYVCLQTSILNRLVG
jgi:hypothetical protein